MKSYSKLIVGLDFDNTLITYDFLFKDLAVKKGLIASNFPEDKKLIRKYLKETGNEELFITLQAEVYGLNIKDAEPSPHMLSALKLLKSMGAKIIIVSHKTKVPYSGPAYDLRKGALEWMSKNEFFSKPGLWLERKNIIFEETKEEKIQQIIRQQCSIYIDDLTSILENLPDTMMRIHYLPQGHPHWSGGPTLQCWSKLISIIDSNQ